MSARRRAAAEERRMTVETEAESGIAVGPLLFRWLSLAFAAFVGGS
jgi:hypothetical protein